MTRSAFLKGAGGDTVASSPAEFASFIDAERRRYETIVGISGMTVD